MNARIIKDSIKDIKIIFYDFDGVMTDNKVYVNQDGKEILWIY
mgnify:CR=1 FL=1